MTLRETREKKGITAKDTARALGVAVSSVLMWETGYRKPKMSNICRLAEFYGESCLTVWAAVHGVDIKALTSKAKKNK